MTSERNLHGFPPGLYFDKDRGGIGGVELQKGIRAPEDHLASVALVALSTLEKDPEYFRHDTKIGVAREISSRIESGDTSFRRRAERTLKSHIYKSGAFLRDIVQANIYTKEVRETNMEGLSLPELLNSEEFTDVPNSWREALTKLSETLPDGTTVGTVAATLMNFSESSTAKDGRTVQGRLNYASTEVERAFDNGPRYWWRREQV